MCSYARSCVFAAPGEPCPYHRDQFNNPHLFSTRPPVLPLAEDGYDVATDRAVRRRLEGRQERTAAGKVAEEFMGEVRAGLTSGGHPPEVARPNVSRGEHLKPAPLERLRGQSGLEAWAAMVAKRRGSANGSGAG